MKTVVLIVGGLVFVSGTVWIAYNSGKAQQTRELEKAIRIDDSQVSPVEIGDDDANSEIAQPVNVEDERYVQNKSYRGLTTVPMEVFDRRDLRVLDVSHNTLTGALPAEVRHLQNLHTLDLSDNTFTGVPAEVGQLSKLETLDLSNNTLTGLPHELGNLQNLNVLDLRGNDISEYDLGVIRSALPSRVQILR
jgi:Leucine-rich repeat (LRR) protein